MRMQRARKSTPRRVEAGFTLAELLIATALLSIVMGALYSLTYTTLGAWRSLERGDDAYREARNALTVFRREVDNMVPGAAPWFEGDAEELTMFVVSEPLELAEADGAHLMQVRYYVERKNRVISLMREERLAKAVLSETQSDDGSLAGDSRVKMERAEKFLMATNLRSFAFRYIWYPAVDTGMPSAAISSMEPIVLDHHRKNWGLPQGIEVEMVVEDPENPQVGLTIKTSFPIRAASTRRSRGAIINLGNS